jgi:hypothetical protein
MRFLLSLLPATSPRTRSKYQSPLVLGALVAGVAVGSGAVTHAQGPRAQAPSTQRVQSAPPAENTHTWFGDNCLYQFNGGGWRSRDYCRVMVSDGVYDAREPLRAAPGRGPLPGSHSPTAGGRTAQRSTGRGVVRHSHWAAAEGMLLINTAWSRPHTALLRRTRISKSLSAARVAALGDSGS